MTSIGATLDRRSDGIDRTLMDVLERRAAQSPERSAYHFRGDRGTDSMTYGRLRHEVAAVAHRVVQVTSAGDRVLLLFPPGLEFVVAFLGCLEAGVVAVPAYPPTSSRTVPPLVRICVDSGAQLVLTTTGLRADLSELAGALPGLEIVATDGLPHPTPGTPGRQPRPTDAALLQYTSGSTASPRGVVVSHANLMANSAQISKLFACGPDDHAVVWLPPYHDMGLIGGVVQPLFAGLPVTLMSPLGFVRSPHRWVRTISELGATISGGPNFGYDLVARTVSAEQAADLDLSRWRVAFNGAEPVAAATLDRFATTFAAGGFHPTAFLPCYGLAEATLLVTGSDRTAAPAEVHVDRESLAAGVVRPVAAGDAASRALISSGRPAVGVDVRVVDQETRLACEEGRVGEVWVSGPNVAQGYHGAPVETAANFGARLEGSDTGPFLRTGDLGFVVGGDLFVTGRLKDLIILRGRNHDPNDLEATVTSAHPAMKGVAAAFTREPDLDQGLLVMVCEVDRRHPAFVPADVVGAVRRAVSETHQLQVAEVVLVRPGVVPRTTSGKVQRRLCRQLLLEGSLEVVATDIVPVPSQVRQDLDRDAWRLARDPAERASLALAHLRAAVASTLHVDPARIEVDTPLAELGLDSLAATHLRHLVEVDLDLVLPLGELLGGASIQDLVDRVATWPVPSGREVDGTTPERAAAAAHHPLSAGQEAMWVLHRLAPESSAYTISCAFRLAAPAIRVEAAFEELARRHPALRTVFPVVDGVPVQSVRPTLPPGWFRSIDARGWEQSILETSLAEAVHRGFDLEHGPVFRVDLFDLGPDEQVLLLCVHHVAADFWSMEVLLSGLGELLTGAGTTAAGASGPGELTPVDYATWQATMLAGSAGEELREYWRDVLSGDLPVLELPTDRPRPAVPSHTGAAQPISVGTEGTEALRELARRSGTTLYTVLLAAFQTFLYRYSGQTDLVVGSPMAGRVRAAFAGTVGHLMTTVPMRADLSGDPTFVELLRRTHARVLGAVDHQDLPLARIVELLGVPREPGRTPIFQHSFTFQQSHLSGRSDLSAAAISGVPLEGRIGDLVVTSVPLEHHAAPFDLSLHLAETGTGLTGSFIYNSDLFDVETVAAMAEHVATVLEAVAATPERRVSALPMVAPLPAPLTAHSEPAATVLSMIEDQVARTPAASAVVGPGTTLTYAELDQAAAAMAKRLVGIGVRRSDRVGIMLDPGIELLVSILAVWKAGAAYVPVDPGYPAERIAFMLEDAAVGAVITQESLRTRLPPAAVRGAVVCVDGSATAGGTHPGGGVLRGASDADLAAIVFTSGSTGRAKGVLVRHRALRAQALALGETMGVTAADRQLLAQSFAFAASVRQFTVPLGRGGSVVLTTREQAADTLGLFGLVRETGVTVMSLNPAWWRHCIDVLDRLDDAARAELLDNDLRLLLSTSETLESEVPRWWHHQRPGRLRFVNMLGHTEMAGIATTYDVPAGVSGEPLVPVGRPIAGVEVHALNESMQPVPPGTPGELYLDMPGLTPGYVRRPDLTAERLVPHPSGSGSRIYRTGDVVRIPRHAPMAYLGRVDEQVKVRGFRIEPAEVEAVLDSHPGVRASAVTAPLDASGQPRLVAYVVASTSPAPTTSELRRLVQSRLPEYFVPSVVVPIAALPLNANGKVDRKALPVPDLARPAVDTSFVAPRTDVEQVIASVWAEVLGIDEVGVHDSFFDLGGTSLSLTRAHRMLCERLGATVAVAKLFEFPTIDTLAGHLSDDGGPSTAAPIHPGRSTAARRRERLESLRAKRRPGRPDETGG